MKRALFALLVSLVVASVVSESTDPASVRITTWNLEWFPNGSAREAPPEKQAQRIQAAADVLKKLNPDILLLQEVRDYDACVRLGEAVQPAAYTVVICSAFKGGKQEEAILAKIPAQAHPGSHGFPDATFDYFFGKNVKFGKPIITQSNVSDHLPVTCDAEF